LVKAKAWSYDVEEAIAEYSVILFGFSVFSIGIMLAEHDIRKKDMIKTDRKKENLFIVHLRAGVSLYKLYHNC
jgi:hypothetical protein